MQEGRRFLWATIFSLGSLTLIARPGDFWYAVLEAFVALCLLALVVGLSWLKQAGNLEGWDAWIAATLAVSVVFFLARHILAIAWQSVRRGIINQHVLLEAAAYTISPRDFDVSPYFDVVKPTSEAGFDYRTLRWENPGRADATSAAR